MWRTFIIILAVAFSATDMAIAQAPTLTERVRRTVGPVEVLRTNQYEPKGMAQLVADSDLVAIGRVKATQSYPSQDQTTVFTDYLAELTELLKDRPAPDARGPVSKGSLLIVRRDGGSIPLDGQIVTVRESQFPRFEVGGSYVLFLRYQPKLLKFEVTGGPQGAFLMEDEKVLPLAEWGPVAEKYAEKETAAKDFLDEIRALVAAAAETTEKKP